MMKGLIKKVRGNKKGFTLAELLVVVAIVGILVAISIPIFTAQLSKARQATNNANLRAAKAAAVAQYMTDEEKTTTSVNTRYYEYDIKNGVIEGSDATAYGNSDFSVVEIGSNEDDDTHPVAKNKVYDTIRIMITTTRSAQNTLDNATIELKAK